VKVVATERGFFNKLREPGEVFEYPLKKGQKIPSWMEQAGAKAKVSEEPEGEDEPNPLD
jgi:hypothetical protein